MIPPGGEGEIKVTLRPKGTHTTITKDIVVHSNDPAKPRFSLTMKGTLLIDMTAEPASVGLHNLAPGQREAGSFSLLRSEGSTATVESATLEDTTNFSLHPLPAEKGALATYEVRFAGSDEVGHTTTNVIVKTTGENTPELKIPVRAKVTFNLSFPKRVAFVQRDGALLSRVVRFTTRRGDPPKLGKFDDPDNLLDIEVLPARGPTIPVRMGIREGAQAKASDGAPHKLFIETDDPDQPRIELEYSVNTRAPTKAMISPGR